MNLPSLPPIDLAAWDAIVFAVLVTIVPFATIRSMRRLRARRAAGDPDARVTLYRQILLEQWIAAPVLLGAWLVSGRDLAGLGLVFPTDRYAVAAWTLVVGACLFLALQAIAIHRNETLHDQVRAQLVHVADIVPSNDRELRTFAALSVTAGICEELVYRGYLMAVLASLGGPTVAVVGSTLAFTIGHAYQPRHLGRIAGVGLVTSGLYLLGGSIVPVMFLHAAIDLSSGFIGRAVASDHSGGRRLGTPDEPLQAST